MPADLPAIPAYGRASLGEVLSAAASALGVPAFAQAPSALDLARHDALGIVVLLVDGLGWEALRAHAAIAPALAGADARPITAAFPTTTPVGLASLGTALPPGGHGLLGATFLLPEEDRVLHPLGWGDDPSPLATQPEATVFEACAAAGLPVRSVGPRAFRASGLTRAALRGADYRGADTVGEFVAAAAAPAGERALTYAYWADLDKTGHVHGVDSEAWREELRHVDGMVGRLRDALPASTLLVVTADHGMVDCDGDARIDVDALPDLGEGVAALAGEPRMRHVYARRGASREVESAWREALGDRAWVLDRATAIESGLFGPVDPSYGGRIGDVVALARERYAFVSPSTDPNVSSLRGQHGSASPDEMGVPLAVLAGDR